MQNFGLGPRKAALIISLAIPLAACSTSGRAPVNFLELTDVVEPLPGTKGKTLQDQRNIDLTIAQSCASGVLGSKQCDVHTKASAERKAELRAGK